jgi:hypothetical protein
MLTKELPVRSSSCYAQLEVLPHGQAKASCSYSFCLQQGSRGFNNQDGIKVLYFTATVSLKGEEVESANGHIRESNKRRGH